MGTGGEGWDRQDPVPQAALHKPVASVGTEVTRVPFIATGGGRPLLVEQQGVKAAAAGSLHASLLSCICFCPGLAPRLHPALARNYSPGVLMGHKVVARGSRDSAQGMRISG